MYPTKYPRMEKPLSDEAIKTREQNMAGLSLRSTPWNRFIFCSQQVAFHGVY